MTTKEQVDVDLINQLIKTINENWTKETDIKISNDTRGFKIGQSLKGRALSEEHRLKIGLANKQAVKKPPSKKCIEAARVTNKGRKLSDSHKEKIIKNLKSIIKGQKLPKEYSAFRIGKKLSKDTIAKRTANRDYTVSDDTRKKQSIAHKNRKKSDEHLKNILLAGLKIRKPVSINDIVYDSVTNAANVFGINKHTVTKRVNSLDTKWKMWFFISNGPKLNTVKKLVSCSKPVLIGSEQYDSITAAAKKLGLAKSTIKNRIINIINNKWKDWKYLDKDETTS